MWIMTPVGKGMNYGDEGGGSIENAVKHVPGKLVLVGDEKDKCLPLPK
jgi:hypothetical protein